MPTAAFLLTCTVLARSQMSDIRTVFQTNVAYDARVDLCADAVLVHNHGGSAESTAEKIRSWTAAGHPVFRMFFADSDAGRLYTTGKWDGEDHTDEAETRSDGSLIECADVRPYMIPTPGWTRFLTSLIREGLDAGAVGIVPEEPLSHTAAGHSGAFKAAYGERFGEPWVDPQSSPEAFFRHSWVLSDLYLNEIRELAAYARHYGMERGRDVSVLLPNHSLLSSAAGGMVFPNAAACREAGIDAFIGQVWTGPVGWSMGTYAGRQEDRASGFFENAFLLYSSFANLTRGTSLPMYFLIDPVEDDPRYPWEEYHVWYEKCVAACLMFPSVTRYEVMPWPDRIFLPGYSTGGGTPGPAEYRSELMAVGRALQDMEDQEGIRWTGGTEGIGVLVSDTMGWMRGGPGGETEGRPGDWNNFHGLALPLIKKGIPVQVVPIERMGEAAFADDFRVLLLSYNLWKPLRPVYHEWLAGWVRRGGVLVFSGVKDVYDGIDMWWKSEGFPSAHEHLRAELGLREEAGKRKDLKLPVRPPDGAYETGWGERTSSIEHSCGKGRYLELHGAPYLFSKSPHDADLLLSVIGAACEHSVSPLRGADFWSLRRGRYIAAYSFNGEHAVEGPLIDVFDPDVPYLTRKIISSRTPGLFYLPDRPKEREARILFSSGRTLAEKAEGRKWAVRIAGPGETAGRIRIWASGLAIGDVSAVDPEGNDMLHSWEWDEGKETFIVRFGFHPQGTVIGISFADQARPTR